MPFQLMWLLVRCSGSFLMYMRSTTTRAYQERSFSQPWTIMTKNNSISVIFWIAQIQNDDQRAWKITNTNSIKHGRRITHGKDEPWFFCINWNGRYLLKIRFSWCRIRRYLSNKKKSAKIALRMKKLCLFKWCDCWSHVREVSLCICGRPPP